MKEELKPIKLLITEPEQIVMLNNPFKVKILNHLKDAKSASEVAKLMHETPQKINYHMKKLEQTGLVERVGHRQVRNLVEVLYEAVANDFVVPDNAEINNTYVERMRDQGSLSHLYHMSEEIKNAVIELMSTVEDSYHIPSATLDFLVHFMSEDERVRFVEDYVKMVKELMVKHKVDSKPNNHDESLKVMIALYPWIEKEEGKWEKK